MCALCVLCATRATRAKRALCAGRVVGSAFFAFWEGCTPQIVTFNSWGVGGLLQPQVRQDITPKTLGQFVPTLQISKLVLGRMLLMSLYVGSQSIFFGLRRGYVGPPITFDWEGVNP